MKYIYCALIFCVGLVPKSQSEEIRLVTLGTMPTATVCALDAAGQLVGMDQSSAPFMRQQPTAALLNYHRTTSSEAILSLKPSHVIVTDAAGPRAAIDQIVQSGVSFLSVNEPANWSEVTQGIQKLATFIGRDKQAEALIAEMEKSKMAADQHIAQAREQGINQPKVLFVMSSGSAGTLLCAGEESGANAVIQMAGGVNAAHGFKGYKSVSTEALILLQPEVVLYPGAGGHAPAAYGQKLAEHQGLQQSPAALAGRIHAVDLGATLGFGPSIGSAVVQLAEWFYPNPENSVVLQTK